MSHIKAGLIPLEANVRARLLFTPGFNSNQVFLCFSTLGHVKYEPSTD